MAKGPSNPCATNSPNAYPLNQDISAIKASSIQVPQSDPSKGSINGKFYDSNPDTTALDYMGDY